uniref:AB hydrolase-1 domain-containing protein n=1 Tax=Cyanothece sp. (strain PCC 7425 / ATCC 29141) TaxID=395961 RepID=B8HM36_CYAP4
MQTFLWNWEGQTLDIAYDVQGQGEPLLLLPAFSTVSSREEMRPLAEKLATQFQVVSLDWPGFGDSSRLPLDYRPPLFQQLLRDFVQFKFDHPISVVAAGHASGYVMKLAQAQPPCWSQIVLISPTWRGPFPTMGMDRGVADFLREVVRSPFVGEALYALNTAPPFLQYMYQSHVYVDASQLTPEFIERKHQITQHPGGRFAPAAFVTGALDPVESQAEFIRLFTSLSLPVLVIIGEQAPPKSKVAMMELTRISGVESKSLPGSLGMYEEFASEIAEVMIPFLHHPQTV